MNAESTNTLLSEKLADLDELNEKLLKLEENQKRCQERFEPLEHKLTKIEKKVADSHSIKIYQDIIKNDIKNIRVQEKKFKKDLKKTKKYVKKNSSELHALAKLFRYALKQKGLYVDKKKSIKKMISYLPYSSHILLGEDKRGGTDELKF